MKRSAGLFLVLALGVSAFASITADRFGALYFPGEVAAFRTDQSGTWKVIDWQGAECAKGEIAEGAVAVVHDALGKRFGAYKLEAGTNATWFAFVSKGEAVYPWIGAGAHCSWMQDERLMTLLTTAGIGTLRDDILWEWIEQQKGVYGFEKAFNGKLEAFVDRAVKAGVHFRPVLNGTNKLYENPLNPQAYSAFAAAAAKHYAGRIDTFEIFNEPHNFAFPKVYLPEGGKFRDWQCKRGTPWVPKHVEVTRMAVAAMKAANPAVDAGVGVEDYWDWFKYMLTFDLVRKDDLVTLHPYDHEHYPPEGNWFFRDNGKEVKEYLLSHGGATRFAFTECGWTTYESKKDATHAFVGNYPPCSYVQQAQYLVRYYILSRQYGAEYACQYDFKNDGPKRTYTEDNFGLVHEDYTPKPSYTAIAAMARLLGAAEPLGSLSKDEKKYRIYGFRKDSRTILACWALGGAFAAEFPAGFPVDKIRAIDLQGNEVAVPLKDGKLQLTEIPVYLALPRSQVKFGTPFNDHAVLQRGRRIPVWGTAMPGEKVTVTFGRESASAVAGADGKWKVEIGPFGADKDGKTLWANDAAATDVVVGEVWFCSGQSNADCPIWGNDPHYRDGNGALMRELANKPFVRLVKADNVPSAEPRYGYRAKWTKMTPAELKKARPCSAMGYYYALELANALDVPVGLVDASWGGTTIDAWTPKSGYANMPDLADIAAWSPVRERKDWKNENRKAPFWDWHQQPSFLYNGMVAAFAPMAIRGIIWYQGCHNAYGNEAARYATKMHALYNGWRTEFANPDLKLYFVQLAPYPLEKYAELCLQQAKFAAEEPNAEMSVINDLGNLKDIHPNNKEPVARRLAAHALRNEYGFGNVECESSVLRSSRVENGKFVLSFDHATGWYVYSPDWQTDCGFEVCGEDGVWKPAVLENIEWMENAKGEKHTRGRVKGTELVVSSAEVPEPKRLRFLCGNPRAGILYNQVCLPLGVFEVK